jgi:hypothetical protein
MAMARFLETGGQPPPGVRLLGRWTQLDLCGGFVLLESEDPHALAAFAHGWSDVVELTIAPVLEDQALSEVLQRARRPSASAAAHANDVPPETYSEDVPVAPETDLPSQTDSNERSGHRRFRHCRTNCMSCKVLP